jgi:hypothetical protein
MNPTKFHGKRSDRRIGLSSFVVPHQSFDWYVRGIAVSALATGALFGVLTWIYHRQLLDSLGLSSQGNWPELMAQYDRLSLIAAGVVTVASAVFITLISMFLFHRIVGPIYRLKLHMLHVLEGGPGIEPLRFRDTDQLADVCELYNQLLHSLDLVDPKPDAEGAPGTR